MALLDEVRDKLASTSSNTIRAIVGLPEYAPGYIIRENYWYGVAVPYDGKQIEESFANARIRSANIYIQGRQTKMLILECGLEEVRRQFASLCVEFLDPGQDNTTRISLLSDPYVWWKKWRELLGNSIYEKKPYQILGELLTLEYFIKHDIQASWQGASGKTQDIATDFFNCEVKSTLDRYSTEITVSSKFQLDPHGKPIKLSFVRFEPFIGGDSLKKVIERLEYLGCNKNNLIHLLGRQGIVPGNIAYTSGYNLLEMRLYDVDETFPVITDKCFVDGHMPQNVIRFTYTLDLAGIPYISIS